jgi:hypothetical protein
MRSMWWPRRRPWTPWSTAVSRVDPVDPEYADVFPNDHPGLPSDRGVQLEINLEPGAKPASKAAYRLLPAEMDELKTQLAMLL